MSTEGGDSVLYEFFVVVLRSLNLKLNQKRFFLVYLDDPTHQFSVDRGALQMCLERRNA